MVACCRCVSATLGLYLHLLVPRKEPGPQGTAGRIDTPSCTTYLGRKREIELRVERVHGPAGDRGSLQNIGMALLHKTGLRYTGEEEHEEEQPPHIQRRIYTG